MIGRLGLGLAIMAAAFLVAAAPAAAVPVSGPRPCIAHYWTHDHSPGTRLALGISFWERFDELYTVYPDLSRNVGYSWLYRSSNCTPRQVIDVMRKCLEAGEVVIPVRQTFEAGGGVEYLVFVPGVPLDWAIHIVKHALRNWPAGEVEAIVATVPKLFANAARLWPDR